MAGDRLIRPEFIIHIPEIVPVLNSGNFYRFISHIAVRNASVTEVMGGGDHINPLAAFLKITQHLNKFCMGIKFAVVRCISRQQNDIR